MTTLTEGRHPGEGLLSEANFHRSRGKATIKSGSGVIEPGAIFGKITAGGKFAPSPAAETVGVEEEEQVAPCGLCCDVDGPTLVERTWPTLDYPEPRKIVSRGVV